MKRILSSVMSKETGIMVIIGICLLVLFIGILKQRADLVLNFVVRMAAGAVAIVSVSYTHLNVYKRQHHNQYGRRNAESQMGKNCKAGA